MRGVVRIAAASFAYLALVAHAASALAAGQWSEAPSLHEQVLRGSLPPVEKRLPAIPRMAPFPGSEQEPGRPGDEITMLLGRARDLRLMFVIGYARLMVWTPAFHLEPDILEKVDVADGGRSFTLHLRDGHRWSDGFPFTTEDFRYWWEDVANNRTLSPFGPPAEILLNGQPPEVEILSSTAIRYKWDQPNPYFLPSLAGARPNQIYTPAHYLKKFHQKYALEAELLEAVNRSGQRNWAQLHNLRDNFYAFSNPALPTLQPWQIQTAAPAERFVFARNPYFHRVDREGMQLPYLDRINVQIADGRLIPAKTGAGEVDLQFRYLRFDNYTFLKSARKRNNFDVRLWKTSSGSHLALYPNLNASDPVWRKLNRDVRFRRALSLSINREEINQVVYYGLVQSGQDTVLRESPLFRESYLKAWADYDLTKASQLLDELGLSRHDSSGVRLLPDGRQMEIIVETSGESTEETDILNLISDSWRKIGIRLFSKPSQLDVLRNRVYAGDAIMVISKGIDNGVPTALTPPRELVPVDQAQYQWPKWGQYYETRGDSGEPVDTPEGQELLRLLGEWQAAATEVEQANVWDRILEIRATQLFTIGIVSGVLQPLVVRNTLRNVPENALFSFDPGGYLGMYNPDMFWIDR